MEFKLLVDDIEEQRIIKVGISGSYFDESKVLWDERDDGNMPPLEASKMGGYERDGNKLVFRKSKRDAGLLKKDTLENERKNIRLEARISDILRKVVREELASGTSRKEVRDKLEAFFRSAFN